MLLVGRVSSHPAIVMQLDDQVEVLRRFEDRILDLVEAGGLIGWSEEDSRLLRIQPPPPQESGRIVIAALKDVIELGQADQVHRAPMQAPRGLKLVDPILALHEDMITVLWMLGEVAIENVLDPSAVIQEAEQSVPVFLGVANRVPHDNVIERPLFFTVSASTPLPISALRARPAAPSN